MPLIAVEASSPLKMSLPYLSLADQPKRRKTPRRSLTSARTMRSPLRPVVLNGLLRVSELPATASAVDLRGAPAAGALLGRTANAATRKGTMKAVGGPPEQVLKAVRLSITRESELRGGTRSFIPIFGRFRLRQLGLDKRTSIWVVPASSRFVGRLQHVCWFDASADRSSSGHMHGGPTATRASCGTCYVDMPDQSQLMNGQIEWVFYSCSLFWCCSGHGDVPW